jgi:6-phosphogluconate dehydrogenase (decarboxylating)
MHLLEGFAFGKKPEFENGRCPQEIDAETTPLRHQEHYQFDLNLADVAEVWRRGSVIASWLLDLTADALAKDPALSKFSGRVSDSGENRWTIKAAIDEGVPVPVLTTALYERFASRGEADFQDRLLSAMRFGFGGHLEKPAKQSAKQVTRSRLSLFNNGGQIAQGRNQRGDQRPGWAGFVSPSP